MTGTLYERYRKMRDMFQSAHPIRIAVMGGLHRTALATHLLGNWKIHNEPPSVISVVPLTPVKIDSPLLYDFAVHVITPTKIKNPPKLQDFSNEYLQKLRKISEDVNDRTYRQMKVNFTGQLFDIMADKTPENITNLRFIPSDIFESSKVSITHYIM